MTKQTKIFLTRLQYGLAIGGLIFIPFDRTYSPSIILFGLAKPLFIRAEHILI